MRVYVCWFLVIVMSLCCHAQDNDDREVTLVGDQNYKNTATLIYDGIDISNYQKDINWDATANDPNIKYVYVKATEGATHKQHRYRRNIEHARQRGVKVGSYHFMTTTAPIRKQFENFISVALPNEQDLVPLLDVEKRDGWTIKQLQDSVMLFAQLLEEHYGCKPMIYASSSYFNNYLGPSFRSYPLFIARYSKSEPQLSYGAKWILWQFSDRGRIDGIDALVDLSRFNKGYSIKDITYRGNKSKKRRRDNGEVPRPKVKHPENREVPLSPRQRQEMQNRNVEKTEAQKRGEENERKRQKLEEEKRKKQKIEEEKRRKEEAKRAEEKRKADEKRRKEEEKRRKEIEKRQKELDKKRQEDAKKQQEAAARQAREQAQERMRREKERAAEIERYEKDKLDRQRKDELEKAKQERIENQKREEAAKQGSQKSSAPKASSTYKPKGNNQSSADNEEIRYNTKNKKGNAKN